MEAPGDESDIAELIATICARAGMILEDAVLPAVTMPRQWNDAAGKALDQLARDIGQATMLVRAAQALAARITP